MRWLHAAHVLILLLLVAGAGPVRQSDAARHRPVVHTLVAFVTGYLWTGYRTATGVWPRVGLTVAVDPRVIPLGSFLHIDGLAGTRIAQDTGGDVVGAHVDVFVGSVQEAYAITGERRVVWWR